MNRLSWIMKEIYKDGKKNFKWVIRGIGLMILMIGLIKILDYYNLEDFFLPIVGICVPIGMLIYWYSMSYDQEQNKIIDKLKESK